MDKYGNAKYKVLTRYIPGLKAKIGDVVDGDNIPAATLKRYTAKSDKRLELVKLTPVQKVAITRAKNKAANKTAAKRKIKKHGGSK